MRVCRICLTKNDLSLLFGDLSSVRFSSKELILATGVQIYPNDGLPQYACASCINLIKSSLYLRTMSTQANLNLKKVLQKSSIKNEMYENDMFNNDYFTNNFYDEYNDYNDIGRTVDLESNSDNSNQFNTDNYQNDDMSNMIEVPIINENDLKSTGIKVKKNTRSLKKRKKMHKNISIDDLESRGSNSDDFSNENNIKIEDFESDSDVDFKTDRTLDGKLNICDTLNNKNKLNYSFKNKHKAINDNQSLSNKNTQYNLNIECKKNEKDINKKSNDFSINKLEINDMSTITNKNSSINLNNTIYYNLSDLDDLVVKNGSKKKIEKKNDYYLYKHTKYYALAGKMRGAMLQCKECKQYIKKQRFISHAKHHFEPEFTCEYCGKRFYSKSHMIYHQQRLHGRRKRLSCDKCDYTAVYSADLINHERISHSGERPFICDLCNATFPLKRNVVQHMKSHFGVRNVQCDKCPKMFKCKSHLWSHQHRVHFDNYDFHCYLCPETYKSVKPVKKHLLNVHGIPEDQQLKIKYVRTKKISEVPESSANTVIPSRKYVKNIELK